MNYFIDILDVGHGDSIVIRTPGGKTCIVDCHKRGSRVPTIDFLRQSGICEIDFVLITHPHIDHYSGALELLEYCKKSGTKVGFFADCGVNPKEVAVYFDSPLGPDDYSRLIDYVTSEAAPFRFRECADCTTLLSEGRFKITALRPSAKVTRKIVQDAILQAPADFRSYLNHFSVVLFVEGASSTALLLSDSEKSTQEDIRDHHSELRKRRVNLFKISHHGSTQNYHHDFLDKLRDKRNSLAAISTGCRYSNMPSSVVLKGLSTLRVPVYATNVFDYSAKEEQPLQLPNTSIETMEAIERLTHPISSAPRLVPYHGDISFEFRDDGSVAAKPQFNQPALV